MVSSVDAIPLRNHSSSLFWLFLLRDCGHYLLLVYKQAKMGIGHRPY